MNAFIKMLSLITACAVCFSTFGGITSYADGGVEINEENFPDARLRDRIAMRFDKDKDNFLSDEECENARELDCSNNKLTTLKGIEYLTGLEILLCDNNELTELDVSHNTKLKTLHCTNNQISELDLSANVKLEELECLDNDLTRLDLGEISSLTRIWCDRNELTELDVSHLILLNSLICRQNNITKLDISNCVRLTNLSCERNHIRTLDISKNLFLLKAYSTGSEWGSHFYLYESGNTTYHLQTDDIVEIVTEEGHTPEEPPIEEILPNEDDIEINEKSFPDENFREYVTYYLDRSGNGYLSQKEINSITEITCSSQIISLKGIEYFTELKTLDCSECELLSEIDVSRNTKLEVLDLSWCNIAKLDVSKNTALKELFCGYNNLKELDVSNNTALTRLHCYRNQLTELDVSNNTELTSLRCERNMLTELDVSNNHKLEILSFDSNEISQIDLSACTELQDLDCDDTLLTSLDVSGLSKLQYLNCSNNALTELNISSCRELVTLACYGNLLTSLDLTGNYKLELLWCSDNKLKALDLMPCTSLRLLECYGNDFTELDISNCNNLIEAYSRGTKINHDDGTTINHDSGYFEYTVENPNDSAARDYTLTLDSDVSVITERTANDDSDSPIRKAMNKLSTVDKGTVAAIGGISAGAIAIIIAATAIGKKKKKSK